MIKKRRPVLKSLLFTTLIWFILAGVVAAQEPGRDPGSMPQNALFRASLLFSQALPFLAGLGILIGLFRARTLAAQKAANIAGGTVRRHSLGTVSVHWLNALVVLIGLGTAAMLLRWVNQALDLQLLYVLHYVGAAFVVYILSYFVTFSIVSGGTGLIPRLRDVLAALGELVSYLEIYGEPGAFGIKLPKSISLPIARLLVTFGLRRPKEVGKFLATKKALSFPVWTILLGVMLLTGLVKTLRYTWPIPSQVVGFSTWVHDLTTIGIVIWLVVHIASTTLIPRNWPLLKSMFVGTVPEEYVKAHHPTWYRELKES